MIPHITNEIKKRIGLAAKTTGAEVVLVEVGGTVGDIESQPFLEAMRQMRTDVGRDNALFVHVTWLPHIGATDELKTKPTQHSVRELRSLGISPDIIVARSDYPVNNDLRQKIALFLRRARAGGDPAGDHAGASMKCRCCWSRCRWRRSSCRALAWRPKPSPTGASGKSWWRACASRSRWCAWRWWANTWSCRTPI